MYVRRLGVIFILPVLYDMGWQKILSGRRYESSSGHDLIIGRRIKGFIGMVLYSKACHKCDSAENGVEEAEQYECPNNFKRSLKIMESFTILNMVEYALYNCFFIIDVIFRDDDSTMQAVPKHPSKGARGQVLKPSKGKLDEEIPDPSFLADPSR